MAAIKILTGPTALPIGLRRVKSQLRLDLDDDSEDEYLGDLIGTAIERAQYVTNLLFCTQTVREYRHHFPGPHRNLRLYQSERQEYAYDHHDHRNWELMRGPVQSILQIQYIDQLGLTQTQPTEAYNSDLVLQPATLYPAPHTYWPITRQGMPNTTWVDYVVGYSVDHTLVPHTLKAAMAMMVAHWYGNREPIQQARVSELPLNITDLLFMNKIWYQA